MPLNPEMTGDLRGMVRDVLREVMANRTGQPAAAGVERVRIASDQDLAAFVARLLDPQTSEAVRSGRLRFSLQGSPPEAAAKSVPAAAAALDGVITEHRIDKMAGTGTLVLAPDAVLTPLARDKVRRLGLKIERRR